MRRRVTIVSVVFVAVCSCSAPEPSAVAQLPEVRFATVTLEVRGAEIVGVGVVNFRHETPLGFTSAGLITQIRFQEGDSVRPGQLLAALDPTSLSADLTRVLGEHVRASAEYRRSASLMKQGWITRNRFESAAAALASSDAAVKAARFQITYARVVAPHGGTVLARLAEPGQVIAAGTPVVLIGDKASGYVLKVPISDHDAARITIGTPASVTIASLDGTAFPGKVVEVAGRADRETGTFAIGITLPADQRLRSGQIGTARIAIDETSTGAFRIPSSAIFAPRADEAFVYVLDRSTRHVSVRKVSIGEIGDDGVRVTSGLRRGELVATSRIDRLKNGMTVVPIVSGR